MCQIKRSPSKNYIILKMKFLTEIVFPLQSIESIGVEENLLYIPVKTTDKHIELLSLRPRVQFLPMTTFFSLHFCNMFFCVSDIDNAYSAICTRIDMVLEQNEMFIIWLTHKVYCKLLRVLQHFEGHDVSLQSIVNHRTNSAASIAPL